MKYKILSRTENDTVSKEVFCGEGDNLSEDISGENYCHCRFVFAKSASLNFYYLANSIFRIFDLGRDGSRLAVLSTGIWQSSEDTNLAMRFYEALGVKAERLWGTVLKFESGDDGRDVVSLIHMALLFAWDLAVWNGPGSSTIVISHDEFVDFFGTPDQIAEIKKIIGAK